MKKIPAQRPAPTKNLPAKNAPAKPAPRQNPVDKTPQTVEPTFDACLIAAARELAPGLQLNPRDLEAMAHFEYPIESAVKQRALEQFLKTQKIDGKLCPLIPSPMSRNYRTTSKRRASFSGGKFELLIEQRRESVLEASIHADIFSMIHDILSPSHYQPLTRHINYCVIRGSYQKCAVIINVDQADSVIVRKLKLLAAEIQRRDPRVISCFMYLDETRSDYYLESRRPEHGVAFKKLFGPDTLDIRTNELRLLYPPTVFSQVNESILPQFTSAVRELLDLNPTTRLLDLYCGYGLLGLSVAQHAASLIGMEIEGPSVKAAAANAAHLFKNKNIRFIAAPVTANSLREKLPPPSSNEVIILDPPRQGTATGVIEELALRRPRRVLHIFCGTDGIPGEIRRWRDSSYRVSRILPLDMFPGSMNLETLILLEPLAE